MKKLKLFLTLLLMAVGVNSALADNVLRGRLLSVDEIKAGGKEILLYMPYPGGYKDRYFQSNDAGNAFLTLNNSENQTLSILSNKCVFVVEKVEGVENGIRLKHKATGKYLGDSGNKPAPVEGAANAVTLIVSAVGNANFDSNFGYSGCEYNGSHAIRLKKNGTGNYMNSNGPQWYSGTGCWSAYVPFEAEYIPLIAANYVYTILPSTDLTKYLSTTTEVKDASDYKTYIWSETKENFVLTGSAGAWQLQSTLTGKYVGTGNGHGGVAWDCLNNPTTTWTFTEVEGQEDVFKLRANQNTYSGYLGWKTENGHEGVVFTNMFSNNTWKFTKVCSYVTVKYMDGTNEVGSAAQGGVDFNQTVEALAEANLPDGYYLTQGQTFATVSENGVFEYSVNVTPLPACYTMTYVDENGNELYVKTEVSSGLSVFTRGINKVSVDAVASRFLGTKNFLIYDFISATANGIEYTSWADLKAAVTESADVTVKLDTKVQAGKFYTFRHAGNMPTFYMYDTGEVLNATHYNKADDKYVFTFEDAGNGRFYIHNAGTNRYVKRTGASGMQNDQNIPTLASLDPDNCRYYVTNANTNTSGRTDIYGIVDAVDVANPITGSSEQRYLHTNGQNGEKHETSHKVVRWSIVENFNSQWHIDEVPVITLKFKIGDNVYDEGISYTAPKSGSAVLPYGKVLSTFTGISFDNYAVEAYILGENTYTNRTQFFQTCHNLTADATATIVLREKTAGEVDVTIELWKEKGKGYANEDMSDANPKVGNDWTANLKVWALTDGGQDIKGSSIPTGVGFKIVSSEATGVGGMISETGGNHEHYHYGHVITNPWCICFQDVSANHTGTTFTMSVSENSTDPTQNYYILQYSLGGFPGTVSNLPTLTNPGGGTVTLGNPDSGARQYNLTDTPAAHEAGFTVTSAAANSVAANYFRVRIVNQTYLENSMERGYAICSEAFKEGAPGYPQAGTEGYEALSAAFEAYDGTLGTYIPMLKAYSKYISCTDLNMPADCQVYTLSFKNSYGTKMLVNNGDAGLEIVAYNDENRGKASARWISHENAAGKLVFVNKKDGKYLLANDSGVGVSETYDASENSFTTRATTQDMTDYMASATDEKLLGAVCMKNAAGTNKLTMQNADSTFVVKTAAEFNDNFSSAMLIEAVDGGKTYTDVAFHKASDDKYYATYYGFYPVENPSDIEMYYVTGTKDVNDQTYLTLQPVSQNVIKPEFPVILITENADYADEENETTHLHIGEYTTDKKSTIADLLEANPNKLKGTLEEEQSYSPGTVYVLNEKSNGVGFYKYTGDYLPVGKAYYETEAGMTVRGFLFDVNGVETTIELNAAETSADAVIYDLSGRRVKSAANGLYIINGKKVVK